MNSTLCGLDSEEYHNGAQCREHLSSTSLKLYAASPKAYKQAMEAPAAQTDAMKFGSLFHGLMACLAEHDGNWDGGCGAWLAGLAKFEAPVNPKTGQPYGAATKAYAEAYQQFLADNQGKEIADAAECDLACGMAHSLLYECGSTSELARKLLRWGEPEVSHFVEVDGLKCKYRPDLETKRKIIDYKTVVTSDLSEKSINGIIAKFGYDISAAYYLWLEHERSGEWKTFYWVFVSKMPPFDAVMADASNWTYRLDPDTGIMMPQVGAIKMKRLLGLHAKCMRENYWPGAEIHIPADGGGRRIMTPAPPPWEVSAAASMAEQTF